ncbi:MRG-domain-containing protein [Biscogniauxia sp. FL1348]|nr:MRG-domain-containing protein [Biscogniauxia sp. FL1348]
MESPPSISEAQQRPKRMKRSITLADYDLPTKRTRSHTQALARLESLPSQETTTPITSPTSHTPPHESQNINVLSPLPAELKPSAPRPIKKATATKGTKNNKSANTKNDKNTTKNVSTKNNKSTNTKNVGAKNKGTTSINTKNARTKQPKNAEGPVTGKKRSVAAPVNPFLAKEARYASNGDKSCRLIRPPPPGYRYLDARMRELYDPADFDWTRPRPPDHPKLKAIRKIRVPPRALEVWYDGVASNVKKSIAGVPSSRPYQPRRFPVTSSLPFGSSTLKYFPEQWLEGKANTEVQEDAFHSRPSIKLIVPDVLKALLVDDWENITKNMQLVPIPHPKPVTKLLEDYAAYEIPKRPAGSSQIDILEETLAGLKEYFDKTLGRILLYRFERVQYADIHKKWASDPEFQGKVASDIYGAEHLTRLMVVLPELIAQTNMDQQSVNRLREELSKFCVWLSKNTSEYFVSSYETATTEYVQSAKN